MRTHFSSEFRYFNFKFQLPKNKVEKIALHNRFGSKYVHDSAKRICVYRRQVQLCHKRMTAYGNDNFFVAQVQGILLTDLFCLDSDFAELFYFVIIFAHLQIKDTL